MAVVAALSKDCDLDYIWTQADRGPAKDAASYYRQASESGGEPPGRWWGPGARTLGLTIRPDSLAVGYSLNRSCPAQSVALGSPIFAELKQQRGPMTFSYRSCSAYVNSPGLAYDLLFDKRQAPTAPHWAGRLLAAAWPRR